MPSSGLFSAMLYGFGRRTTLFHRARSVILGCLMERCRLVSCLTSVALCLVLVWPTIASAVDIRAYQVYPTDLIYPRTRFTQRPTDTISMRIARNQYGACAFALVADADVTNVTLQIDDLRMGASRIPAKNIDVRVVKVWRQAGLLWTIKPDTPQVRVPELLLKDDTVDFRDSWKGKIYVPPSLPQTFKTNLVKSLAKEIFVTVHTEPAGTPPGTYMGELRFFSHGRLAKTVTLDVQVLPIVLSRSPKMNVIYFEGTLAPTGPDYISGLEYSRELADIRAHGFNGITIYDVKYKDICAAVDKAVSAGFKTVVITYFSPHTSATVAKIREYCQKRNIAVYFYGVDEPVNFRKLKAQVRKSILIHRGGGRVVTAITRAWDLVLDSRNSPVYRAFPDGTYEPLDWANYNLGASQQYINGLVNGTIRRSNNHKIETYYWQIMQEDPTMHRLYSGFYFWRTGLDGIFPYCYMHSFYGFSPYNDHDKHIVYSKWNHSSHIMRALNVVYPSKEGPVPTLQWEAIRQGINDQRYIATLINLSNRKNIDISEDLDAILSQFTYIGFYNTGRQLIRGRQFQDARDRIIDLILKLQSQ